MNTNRRMNTNRMLIAVALFATASCSRQSLRKGQPYAQQLQEGLKWNNGFADFPTGRVQIMSGLSSQMEAADRTNQKFPLAYLAFLQQAEKDGLLKLTEEQQGPLDAIRNMGSRFFTVTWTEKLSKMKFSGSTVLTATFEILQILKDQEYNPSVGFGSAGDEFRLVLGMVRSRPTPNAMALGKYYCNTEVQELKFRAILQYNPFAKTYSYRVADLGNPQDPGWNTQYVK
jgi:hypothetical protein